MAAAPDDTWITVRETLDDGGTWYHANDNLAGTDVYDLRPTTPEFSLDFDIAVPDYTHLLICLLNEHQDKPGIEWLIVTREEVARPSSEHYPLGGNKGLTREVVASSQNLLPHTIIMEAASPAYSVSEWFVEGTAEGGATGGPQGPNHLVYAEGGAGANSIPGHWLHPHGAAVLAARVIGSPDWSVQGYDALYSTWNPEGTTSTATATDTVTATGAPLQIIPNFNLNKLIK